MKAALRARLTTTAWMDELPWVLLGPRTMPKQDMGASVAEIVYGLWFPFNGPGNVCWAR